MSQEEHPPDKKRRRRAAAAFADLRERLTGACGKFAKVEDWRAFLAQHFTPLLNEFGDVLPAGARGLLEGAADVAEPTQAGIAKACEMLRGGLKSVAEEMATRTGLRERLQDRAQRALRPMTSLVPDAIAKTTLGKALVALALAAVGVGSIAGVAAIVAGGDDGGPARPAVLGASASPTTTASATGDSPPEACALVPAAAAEAVFDEPAQTKQNPEIGPQACDYWPSSRPYAENEDHFHVIVQPGGPDPSGRQAVSGIGDEAYWDPTAEVLAVRLGDDWVSIKISLWKSGQPVAVSLDETKALAEAAVAAELGG